MGTEGHRPAGVFWLLEEEILHKERRDFVRRQIAEFAKFAGGERRKSPDRYLFNRAERVMNVRGLTGCRSVAEAAWQSSDTALPIGQVF